MCVEYDDKRTRSEREKNNDVDEKRSSNLQLLLPFRLVAVVASLFVWESEYDVLSLNIRFWEAV